MTRLKYLFAAGVFAAAMVAVTPAAHAQKVSCLNSVNSPNCFVHAVGAGSSAQFLTAGIGADNFAVETANAEGGPGANHCVYHWTGKNQGQLWDLRASEVEPGNVWIVWIGDCVNGNTPTDIWTDIQVDSTVGVRSFYSANTTGNGDQVYVVPDAGDALITPATLWPDSAAPYNQVADTSIITDNNIGPALGKDATGVGDVHVNFGLTDIRPEDAIVATDRAMDTLNATLTGLGYGPENVGTSYLTSQGTSTRATPIAFTLTGGADPISGLTVRPSTTIPIGAAPIVFFYNNNGAIPNPVLNLKSGVGGTGTLRFLASYLFGGGLNGVHCTTDSSAFGGANTGAGLPLKLYLREPLSGTMNTTEFNVFRTLTNTSGSQEKGVGAPPANNPLGGINQASPLNCAADTGARFRVIGNGESRDAVKNNANGLGYQFFAFANTAKYTGLTKYNYLTLDGVDAFGGTALANPAQTPPNCPGPCTVAGAWGGQSFVTLRNGTYGAWSIYRWITEADAAAEADPLGPAHMAQAAQDAVDNSVADFVPFCTTDHSDSLQLYRSHFNIVADKWVPARTGNNGVVNGCGTSLGGDGEAGGDVGGAIEGPFNYTYTLNSTVKTTGTSSAVTWVSGPQYTKGTPWIGATVVINGSNYTVITPNPTATVMHVSPTPPKFANPPGTTLSTVTTAPVTAPGIVGKKR